MANIHCDVMIVLCPKACSLAFTSPGDEMSEVVSCCLPHRQLWVSKLSMVATQQLDVDSNLWLQGIENTATLSISVMAHDLGYGFT